MTEIDIKKLKFPSNKNHPNDGITTASEIATKTNIRPTDSIVTVSELALGDKKIP